MSESSSSSFPLALSLLAAAVLLACGDDPSRGAGEKFVAAIRNVDAQARPLAPGAAAAAATSSSITNDQVFAWAQLTYPELFPGVPAPFSGIVYQGKTFTGQGYANGNYLAVANGEAWGLGPFTNQVLTNFGKVQNYAELVCALIDCGRSGPANACTMPQNEALLAGSRLVTTYVRNTFVPAASTDEFTGTVVVDGPSTFQGQAVVMMTSTTAIGSTPVAGSVKTYLQAGNGGLVRTLGTDTSTSGSGPTTRVVFDPALQNSEFTLQPGQALTKTASMSTTQLNPTLPAVASTRSTTYRFEARESVTVQGRSYDTCRYREVPVGGATVTTRWNIVGSGIPARIETRDAASVLQQRVELKSGTMNGAPLSPGQATLDVASAERMVADYSYVLPICSPGGTPKAFGPSAASYARQALALRQAARIAAAAAARPRQRALAYGATKPADQLGECGGRQTYPSYANANGVTTATMRWENYCSQDADTGATTVLNGSWSFVETTGPGSSGPVRTKYEASSPAGISMVNKDGSGKTIGSQLVTVLGYLSTPGVPGGDATESKPDRMQIAELQIRNDLSAKTYRQTGYTVTSFTNASGGEQSTMSGRGYRSTGYYDLTTTKPIVTDDDGNYLSGTLVSTGVGGEAVVITLVPGKEMQGTMTVNGTPVTSAPACK
ncbi:hypothetical protein [Aquabacterium sp.]|uniref:hypothetical protein n=1 Tax=Aquabacterium sp. TaxID=1872578 RepID=UPI003784556F